MNDLIDTTEMYLRTIVELLEEGVVPLRARIAERLHHSGPTVSQTVARMERDGLLKVHDDRRIALTPRGDELAHAVMRKHRLAECLLVEVIGLDWAQVHDEACRWEHVMSEPVERRLVQILDRPQVSPYGNPIPALEAVGGTPGESFGDGVQPLLELVASGPRRVVLRRMGEHLQADPELLQSFQQAGIRPGVQVEASRVDHGVLLVGPQDRVGVELALAESLFAAPADAAS